jgi:hypothetical protein
MDFGVVGNRIDSQAGCIADRQNKKLRFIAGSKPANAVGSGLEQLKI